jgi:hypothetical protein
MTLSRETGTDSEKERNGQRQRTGRTQAGVEKRDGSRRQTCEKRLWETRKAGR